MSSSFWLIFTPFEEGPEEYLRDVNVPFNAEFFMTALQVVGERNIYLKRCYRVSEDYPLRVSELAVWEPISNEFTIADEFVYKTRNNLEGLPIKVSSKDVSIKAIFIMPQQKN